MSFYFWRVWLTGKIVTGLPIQCVMHKVNSKKAKVISWDNLKIFVSIPTFLIFDVFFRNWSFPIRHKTRWSAKTVTSYGYLWIERLYHIPVSKNNNYLVLYFIDTQILKVQNRETCDFSSIWTTTNKVFVNCWNFYCISNTFYGQQWEIFENLTVVQNFRVFFWTS